MGSRSYIGRERVDGQVAYVYCHSGAYMDINGEILQEKVKTEQSVASLIVDGGMSYITDSGVSYEKSPEYQVSLMSVQAFLDYEDYHIESLFLWRDGEWHVKTCHLENSDDQTWHKLVDIDCEKECVKVKQVEINYRDMVIDDVMVSLNDHETTQQTVVRVLSENGRTVLSPVVDDITQAVEVKREQQRVLNATSFDAS